MYVHVRNTYFILRYLRYSFFFFYKESLSTCQRDAFPFSALPCTVEKFILEWIINLLVDSSIFPPLRRCIHSRIYVTILFCTMFERKENKELECSVMRLCEKIFFILRYKVKVTKTTLDSVSRVLISLLISFNSKVIRRTMLEERILRTR